MKDDVMERAMFYKLVNNVPTHCTIDEYSEWMKSCANERVTKHMFRDELNGFVISTVFLGMNIGFNRQEFFETMVFRSTTDGVDFSGEDDYTARYATYEECREGHLNILRRIKCIAIK